MTVDELVEEVGADVLAFRGEAMPAGTYYLWADSYNNGGANNGVAFTFATQHSDYGGGLNGRIMASAHEQGWKDTVISYPGEVTSIQADFDVNGLYVWHCHIVEHEDNEMMVPFCVGDAASAPGCAGL